MNWMIAMVECVYNGDMDFWIMQRRYFFSQMPKGAAMQRNAMQRNARSSSSFWPEECCSGMLGGNRLHRCLRRLIPHFFRSEDSKSVLSALPSGITQLASDHSWRGCDLVF